MAYESYHNAAVSVFIGHDDAGILLLSKTVTVKDATTRKLKW